MLFSEVLLEQGVDVELPIDIDEIVGILDDEIPSIPIDDRQYRIDTVNRASYGKEWELIIKVSGGQSLDFEVAIIKLIAQKDGIVLFSVPPRSIDSNVASDPKGQLYGRMIFSLLNVFQAKGLLDLPGRLPIE